MTISIAAATRIRDGLYAQVSLGGDARDCVLEAHAATMDDAALPVRVLRGDDEGEWILALASFSITQVVRLAAVTWEGDTLEECEQRFTPLGTRLPTPANVLRRRKVQTMRQVADVSEALGEWEITLDRMIATRDAADICQGSAVLRGTGRESVEGELAVTILDSHGRNVLTEPWICLYDGVRQVPRHKGFYERRVEFSLRIPNTTSMLVIWVHAHNADKGDQAIPEGYACLGTRVVAGMRELWKETATRAYDDERYDEWFASKHAVTQAELMMEQDDSFEHTVDFSVISVVRNASPERLREMVDSVLGQSYGHLELVLVNAVPNNQKLASTVRGLELADARVTQVPLGADFGLAAATSAGIDAAKGDFVCLLGEGDLLAPDALWCLAAELIDNPDADLLYTDEDRIEEGRHTKPRFKPDWDYDLLLGSNFVGGLLAVRANVLREMAPMDRELDGAQSYYLTLYACTRVRKVCHVPRVLYHGRGRDEAGDGATRVASQLVALRRHLTERGLKATARASMRVMLSHEISFELPDEQPLVSVVICNRDGIEALDRCLRSLRERNDYENYEVIIVEQGSVDPDTFEYYRRAEQEDPHVHTVFRQVGGQFDRARLANFGVARAKGSYLLFLAPDVEATDPAWMRRMVSLCARDATGAVAVRLVRPDGTIASSGYALCERGPVALDRYRPALDCASESTSLLHAVTCASGACLMVDATLFAQVKGFREGLHGRFADADLCLRLQGASQRVVIDPQVMLTLHRPLSGDGYDVTRTNWLRGVGRLWASWPFGPSTIDPTLGPNVTTNSPYRTLRA